MIFNDIENPRRDGIHMVTAPFYSSLVESGRLRWINGLAVNQKTSSALSNDGPDCASVFSLSVHGRVCSCLDDRSRLSLFGPLRPAAPSINSSL